MEVIRYSRAIGFETKSSLLAAIYANLDLAIRVLVNELIMIT
jgi:hypothetical protein